jgi:hypothetical protein
MVITKLIGGLGNQMFQYAIGIGLAKRNNDVLKLDITGFGHQEGFATPRKYALNCFNIEENFATKEEIMRFKYGNYLSSKLKLPSRKTYVREKRINYFDENVYNHQGDTYLEGYWQTEKYFADIRKTIVSDFSLRDEKDLDKALLADVANSNSVSLHVRRGDYVSDKGTNQFHGVCGLPYYLEAIAYLKEKISKPTLYVFSDDIRWVKENLKTDLQIKYVSNGQIKDYEELILMSKCKHNIIANSSFSWWGAWLNGNPNKIVIAPKKWFANEKANSPDMVPGSWLKI